MTHYFSPTTIQQLASRVGLETLRTGMTYKPLTFNYGLTQFKEFNPLIYRVLSSLSIVIPRSLRTAVLPFYIGEMMVVLRKPAVSAPAIASAT